MAISMLKIRRPLGRLIFNMGIAIPGKTVFLIETAPRLLWRTHVSAGFAELRNCVDISITRLDFSMTGFLGYKTPKSALWNYVIWFILWHLKILVRLWMILFHQLNTLRPGENGWNFGMTFSNVYCRMPTLVLFYSNSKFMQVCSKGTSLQ